MSIGTPVTSKFHIGQGELRIGAQTLANKLTQTHSVGLLQDINVNFEAQSVDLEGGLPKTLVDTAITRFVCTINANAYEYSRKNIRVMLAEGTEGTVVEYDGSLEVASTTASTTLETNLPYADVVVGDLLVMYPTAEPEKVSVVRVTAKADRGGGNAGEAQITIDATETPTLFNYDVGTLIFKANQIGLGNSTATNYFSAQVVGLEHSTGRPIGFNFWKVAIAGGLNYTFGSDNFASTPITFKVLKPATSEYGVGGALVHLADIVPTHPYGMYYAG